MGSDLPGKDVRSVTREARSSVFVGPQLCAESFKAEHRVPLVVRYRDNSTEDGKGGVWPAGAQAGDSWLKPPRLGFGQGLGPEMQGMALDLSIPAS